MKNLLFLIAALVIIFQLSSCKKIIDRYFPGGPGNLVKDCRISTIKQKFGSGTERSGAFYYTKEGLPLNIVFDNLHEGPFHNFEYDDYNRLTGYTIKVYPYPVETHHYGYAGGRIATDTFERGEYTEPQMKSIANLEYDDQGRIVKEEIEVIEREYLPVSEFITKMYEYDTRGNLQTDSVAYDDKTNFLRTHRIWMFIQRNYSRNNPNSALGYTSNGLPTGFASAKPGFLGGLLPGEITYACE